MCIRTYIDHVRARIPYMLVGVLVIASIVAGILSFGYQPRVEVRVFRTALAIDSSCQMGRGLPVPIAGAANGLSPLLASSPSGVVLASQDLKFGTGLGGAQLWRVDNQCRPVNGFGTKGTEFFLPPSVSTSASEPYPLVVSALTITTHNRVLLAGSFSNKWIVCELTRTGAPEDTFGRRGCLSFVPFGFSAIQQIPPSIAVVAMSTSGIIYLGGNAGEPHSDVQGLLYAVTPRGSIDTHFGSFGHVTVFPPPIGVGTELTGLAVERNGDLVTSGWLGGAGCGHTQVEVLTATGHRLTEINTRVDHSLRVIPADNQTELVASEGDGFELVGWGQSSCGDPYTEHGVMQSIFDFRIPSNGIATSSDLISIPGTTVSNAVVVGHSTIAYFADLHLVTFTHPSEEHPQSSVTLSNITHRSSNAIHPISIPCLAAKGKNGIWVLVPTSTGLRVFSVSI